MTTQEIADKLVNYCRNGQYKECYEQLYSPDILSVEPEGSSFPPCKGFDQLNEKAAKWNSNIKEFESGSVTDAIVKGDHFVCGMETVYTDINDQKVHFKELCIYKVSEGKIIEERFVY